jgi:hypothetical protein
MRLVLAAAALSLTLSGAAFAADSAKVVLDRHVAAMKAGDLKAVMADYADNTLVIAPNGIAPGQTNVNGVNVFDGKANATKLFAVLTAKANAPAMASMTSTYEMKGSDTVLMHWVQFKGTPKEVVGTDIWVIRDGKIITQVVTVAPPKK